MSLHPELFYQLTSFRTAMQVATSTPTTWPHQKFEALDRTLLQIAQTFETLAEAHCPAGILIDPPLRGRGPLCRACPEELVCGLERP